MHKGMEWENEIRFESKVPFDRKGKIASEWKKKKKKKNFANGEKKMGGKWVRKWREQNNKGRWIKW